MKSFQAIVALVSLQSSILTTLALSLPHQLSISNTNATVNNSLQVSPGPYVLPVGNVTIYHFEGTLTVTNIAHTYELVRLIDQEESYASTQILQLGPNHPMGTAQRRITYEYHQSTGIGFSRIDLRLFPWETMTYEHMEGAMRGVGEWLRDKTAERFVFEIGARGLGAVGMGRVWRTDFLQHAVE